MSTKSFEGPWQQFSISHYRCATSNTRREMKKRKNVVQHSQRVSDLFFNYFPLFRLRHYSEIFIFPESIGKAQNVKQEEKRFFLFLFHAWNNLKIWPWIGRVFGCFQHWKACSVGWAAKKFLTCKILLFSGLFHLLLSKSQPGPGWGICCPVRRKRSKEWIVVKVIFDKFHELQNFNERARKAKLLWASWF